MSEDSDSDWDNIEWENGDEASSDHLPLNTNVLPTLGSTTISIKDFYEITEAKEEGEHARKKAKIRRHNFKDLDYYEALQRCKEDLSRQTLCALSMAICENELLCPLLISILPTTLLSKVSNPLNPMHSTDIAREIAAWMHDSFTVIRNSDLTIEEGRDGSSAEILMYNVLPNRAGSAVQINQLFYVLVQSLVGNNRIRLVVSLSPRSLSPKLHRDLAARALANNCLKDNDNRLVERAEASPEEASPLQSWIEVHTNGAWFPVDSSFGLCGDPTLVEAQMRHLNKPVEYVVAMEKTHGSEIVLTDVTARYNFRRKLKGSHLILESESICRSWWEGQLRDLSASSSRGNSDFATGVVVSTDSDTGKEVIDLSLIEDVPLPAKHSLEDDRRQEEHSLRFMNQERSKIMPKSFNEFKDSAVYLLERHLKADEMLNPVNKKVVGLFKGEAVYLQEHREVLRTRKQWRRIMRVVKVGSSAVKVNKKCVRVDGNTVSKEIELFGSWQTENLQIPEVKDGLIPRNEYGNLEIWDGLAQYVPKGSVYVSGSLAVKAAKTFGLQHVPAVIGFESRGGQGSFPRIGGVVVLVEDKSLLEDALYQMQLIIEEKELSQKYQAILSKWRGLVKRALSREALRLEFGH